MIERVAHLAIEVPNLDESVHFYEEYVGLTVTERDGDTVYLTCNRSHHEMIVSASPTGRTAVVHLALEVSDGGLEEAVELAGAAGARVLGGVSEPGIREAVLIEDPTGFRWKLYCGMEEAPERPASAIARPSTFSHYNLASPDVPGVAAFIVDGLGMAPSDWLGSKEAPFVCWFHCPVVGAPHHGIAIINTPAVQVHHISFEYDTIGDVADRIDNYVTRERLLVWGMGRHGTGGGLFAYIEDPSGLMIELSAEMIRIGEDARWHLPEVWDLDDPRGVNTWGSAVPEPWLAHGVPLAGLTASRPA
jgi:catechol 2,3-dioxygenase-like lactoylglutathione lyase family enzyme